MILYDGGRRDMNTTSEKKIISTPNAPKAIGPYAQAVRYGELLFVSGMIPIDPKTGELLTGDFEAEVTLVIENLKAVVEASGMSLKNVLKASVFLKDLGHFGKFNDIYGRYFGDILPARETVQVAQLPRGASIEISVICGALP
jgi:2-iminobutanoate/2-iminopropanoate deaminase